MPALAPVPRTAAPSAARGAADHRPALDPALDPPPGHPLDRPLDLHRVDRPAAPAAAAATATAAPHLAPDAPVFLVLNRKSGRHGVAIDERAGELLRAAGHPHELLVARRPSELARLAEDAVARARRQGGVVVAAGGDGTLNLVAQAVLPTGLPMGILPQGTFNYFGRANAVSQDLTEALADLLAGVRAGHTRPVQVGLVNDRVFLVNASLGLYPRLLEEREAYKRQWGRSRLVALWAGLGTLMSRQRELSLRLDAAGGAADGAPAGSVHRTSTLFVGNNPLQLDQVGLDEADDVRQGSLACVLMPTLSRSARLRLALRGAFGKLDEAEELTRFAARQLQVDPLAHGARTGPRRVKVAIDGESLWLPAPLVFRVAPQPLHLVVPPHTPADDVPGGQVLASAAPGPAAATDARSPAPPRR